MSNRTVRTPKKVAEQQKSAFIRKLGEGFSITGAAKYASIARRTAYEWRDADEAFRADWDAAIEAGTEVLEDEARRRAVDGVVREHSHYSGSTLIGVDVETKYSDTLLIFLLKARKPETYRDNSTVELTGDPNRPLVVERVLFGAKENAPS